MSETRERFRAQVRDDVKRVALEQIADAGPASLSVNAIGKALGVSGPALYRYFAGRDALLTALVLDAYADLAGALREASDGRRGRARLAAVCDAYREWALAQPHRYRLLYVSPTPGYDAHDDELVAAAQRLMDVTAEACAAAGATRTVPRALSAQLRAWAGDRGLDASPDVALAAIAVWWRLHGFVALEIEGNFTSMGIDAEALFRSEVEALQGG